MAHEPLKGGFFPFVSLWENAFMAKRILRVLKWLGTTPAVAVCESCRQQFKAPMSVLTKTRDAQASLQQQFDTHKCAPATGATARE
ncbi:MAG: hypothetical protein JWN74_3164 [Acidobacteriaceae bacterium]|nr:hypothetical protein [Acidobacteriaceae bacterium]